MKKLSTCSITLLLSLLALVSGCGNDNEEAKPKEYLISVHVVGENLAGTGARFTATLTHDATVEGGSSPVSPSVSEAFNQTALDKIYALGKCGTKDLVDVTVLADRTLPANAFIQAEILVDGQVKATTKLTDTTFSLGHCAVKTENL